MTEMDLLKYLKIIGDLPDPKRSLSSCVQSQEIAQANKKVRKAIKSMSRNVDLIGYTVQIYKLKLVKNASHHSVLQLVFLSNKIYAILSKSDQHIACSKY